MSKTIDVMPGDTWTTGAGLVQYRGRQMRFVWVDQASGWSVSNRYKNEIDCTSAQAMNILAAYGYTINHAQPEAKPVRVTHGVKIAGTNTLLVYMGTKEACEHKASESTAYLVVPIAFGPEGA